MNPVRSLYNIVETFEGATYNLSPLLRNCVKEGIIEKYKTIYKVTARKNFIKLFLANDFYRSESKDLKTKRL